MMRRGVLIVVRGLILLGLLLAAVFAFAQTGPGQRLIAQLLGRALSDSATTVEVSGLRGLIPFDFRLQQVRLADAEGPWLELDDLRVSASARALLRGRLEMNELTARRVALHRLPPDDDADKKRALPELPTSLPPVVVRSLAVDELEIGQALLGEDATFRLSGRLGAGDAGRSAILTLDLQRTDKETARASLEGRLDLVQQSLALDIRAADTSGLLAAMTGRSAAGDFQLQLTGEGPLENWEGDLRATAEGLVRIDARIALAMTGTARMRLDGQLEPAPGDLPSPVDALVGERLQLALTAARPAPGQLTIEDLRATTARATLTGSGRLDREERVDAQASLQIADLAALGGALKLPLAGSLDASAHIQGTLTQPQGTLRLAATDLAAAEVHAREVQTTLDLAMLDRLGEPRARLRVTAEGNARELRLPPDLALPPQDVAWQAELSAPLERAGTVAVQRLAVSADHLRLAAQGTLDAATLGGEARATLTVDALAPVAARYGQAVAGAAELDANLEWSAGATPISLDLYGRARELSGLPEGVDVLVGAAPTVQANAIVVPDHSIEVTHLRVRGGEATLDGRLDLALPEQTLDGELSLALPNLAPLSPLLRVDVDGPLTLHAQLGGAIQRPAVELAAQSPGLAVAGEHIDALTFTGQVAGTPDVADGKLRLAVTSRGIETELASGFELRAPSLRLTDLALSAPRTRVGGALSIDLERRLVDGELRGRVEDLRAFAGLLPVGVGGDLQLEAHASAADGAQKVTLALDGNDVVGDFGRLGRLGLQATVSDALRAPRIAADLTLRDFARGEIGLSEGSVRAEGTPRALAATVAAKGDAHVPYDLQGRFQVALDEPIQVRVEKLDGRLADQPLALDRPATLTLAGGTITVDDVSLRSADARLTAGFALGPQQVAAQARLDRLPLALLGGFGGPDLRGQVAGRLSLAGAPDNPRGSIQLNATGVALTSPTAADVPAAALTLSGTLEARRLRLELRGEGVTERPVQAHAELPLLVDLAAGTFEIPPEGQIAGSLNAEIALARVADILALDDQLLEGPLRADLTLGGTVAEPAIDGTVRVDGGHYENGTTGTVLRNVDLQATANRRTVAIQRFAATDGGQGRLSGEGTIQLDPTAGYPVDLRLQIERARLVARDDIVATAGGELTLAGAVSAPKLSGSITINRADVSIAESGGPTIPVIPVEEIGHPVANNAAPDSAGTPFTLALDLTVAMPNQVFVRGRGLDSEWGGKLKVQGTTAQPRVSGTLQVRRGGFELLGRRFDLRQGTIQFAGETPPNPELNIEAVTQAEEITALVRITGRARAPEFQLTSQPSLPEDEVLARVLFNRRASELGPIEAIQLADAINTLRGGGLNLLGRARQTLGLDTLDVTGQGQTGGQVRAGRYLNDNVYVEVGKGTTTDSGDVTVEVEISPNLSLDAQTTAEAQSGIGLRWRFDY